MPKYDDASWHHGGDFPAELPYDQACLHIGMFMGWAIEQGLQSAMLTQQFPEQLERFKQRKLDPVQLLHGCCDDKLTSDDLNEEGNEFALSYYESDDYTDDYEEILGDDLPSLYHVENSWANYERMRERISIRYKDWKSKARRQ